MSRKKQDTHTPCFGDNSLAVDKLKDFVKRVETINEDIAAHIQDRREVLSEAKAVGMHIPTIRKIIRERAMDADKWREEQELMELYRNALGLIQ